MAFKLDREQRIAALELVEVMCDSDDMIEQFAYELIYKRAEVKRLTARIAELETLGNSTLPKIEAAINIQKFIDKYEDKLQQE